MRMIPVLDLLSGLVVRGVGGRRQEYRPVESMLTRSAQPLDVADAIREQLGLTILYVADLDGILQRTPNVETLRALCDDGFEVWIDAGIRDFSEAIPFFKLGAAKVIVGLESLADSAELGRLVEEYGASRVVFSLDLKDGQPLFGGATWAEPTPLGIARSAIAAGVTQMIVLDLVSVGESRGPSTLGLCDQLLHEAPHCRVITGGGVRDRGDLRTLQDHGIDGVLLATALHRGELGREDFEWLQKESVPV